MYCINCGKKIPEAAVFCPECGVKVRTAPPEPSGFVKQNEQPQGNVRQRDMAVKKQINKKPVLYAAAAAAVITAVVILLVALLPQMNALSEMPQQSIVILQHNSILINGVRSDFTGSISWGSDIKSNLSDTVSAFVTTQGVLYCAAGGKASSIAKDVVSFTIAPYGPCIAYQIKSGELHVFNAQTGINTKIADQTGFNKYVISLDGTSIACTNVYGGNFGYIIGKNTAVKLPALPYALKDGPEFAGYYPTVDGEIYYYSNIANGTKWMVGNGFKVTGAVFDASLNGMICYSSWGVYYVTSGRCYRICQGSIGADIFALKDSVSSTVSTRSNDDRWSVSSQQDLSHCITGYNNVIFYTNEFIENNDLLSAGRYSAAKAAHDGTVYYLTQSGDLYSCATSGFERQIYLGVRQYMPAADGVYFTTYKNGLFFTDLSGNRKTMQAKGSMRFLSGANGTVYLISTENKYSLYKLNLSEMQPVVNDFTTVFTTRDGGVYYYVRSGDGYALWMADDDGAKCVLDGLDSIVDKAGILNCVDYFNIEG